MTTRAVQVFATTTIEICISVEGKLRAMVLENDASGQNVSKAVINVLDGLANHQSNFQNI